MFIEVCYDYWFVEGSGVEGFEFLVFGLCEGYIVISVVMKCEYLFFG